MQIVVSYSCIFMAERWDFKCKSMINVNYL